MIGLGSDKKVTKERQNLFARIVKASLVPTDLSLFWEHPVLIASLILPIVILIAFNQWWLGPGCGKGKVQLSCWDQFSWLLNQRTSPCCVYTKYIFGCWLMFLFIIAKKSRLFISTKRFNIYLPPFAFLSSPLARASPGTKSSGNTLSKYLTIICWHLIMEKIDWSYHLKDLHCRFFLSSFREDTSPKLPRSCPILNVMCL